MQIQKLAEERLNPEFISEHWLSIRAVTLFIQQALPCTSAGDLRNHNCLTEMLACQVKRRRYREIPAFGLEKSSRVLMQKADGENAN